MQNETLLDHHGSNSLSSRRAFLGSTLTTAGSLAYWTTSKNAAANTSIAPSDQLAAAVIGAGGIARFHATHQLRPFFQIKAICDVDQQRAQAFNKEFANDQALVCGDHRQLLDRHDIDVFFVCTPDHWHTQITIDALRSGKDVYCEKPLTLTVDEGRLIRKVQCETQQILQVGTQQRSDPNFQTTAALIRSGKLGKVKRVTVAIGGGPQGGPFATVKPPKELNWNRWLGQTPLAAYTPRRCHGNFRWWYEYSGGKMTDWGAHHVDIAQWDLEPDIDGPIKIEVADVNHPVPLADGIPTALDRYNTATSFRVNCQFAHGVELVILDNAADLGFDNGLLFECEGGRFFVNRGKLTGKPVEQLAHSPLSPDLFEKLRKGREIMSHMANFYWSCRNRSKPMSDASSHLRSLNICHAANIAMRLNRDLLWDPKAEEILNDADANRWLSRPHREGFQVG